MADHDASDLLFRQLIPASLATRSCAQLLAAAEQHEERDGYERPADLHSTYIIKSIAPVQSPVVTRRSILPTFTLLSGERWAPSADQRWVNDSAHGGTPPVFSRLASEAQTIANVDDGSL